MPVHVISPAWPTGGTNARAFMEFAVPRLRTQFVRLAKDLGDCSAATRS